MKLMIQFGEETCFEIPNLQITQTRGEWSPGNRVSLSALVTAGQLEPVASATAGESFPEDTGS